MNVRPKRVPRLWCARLGLLPFDVVLSGSDACDGATCGRRSAASAPPREETPGKGVRVPIEPAAPDGGKPAPRFPSQR